MTEQTYNQRVTQLTRLAFSRKEAKQTADVEFSRIGKDTVFATVTWTGQDIWEAIWDMDVDGELSPEARRSIYQKMMRGPQGKNIEGQGHSVGDDLLTSVVGNAIEDSLIASKKKLERAT